MRVCETAGICCDTALTCQHPGDPAMIGQWQAKQQDAPVDKRKSKRHGPPLFLVQLVITIGLVGTLAAAIIK